MLTGMPSEPSERLDGGAQLAPATGPMTEEFLPFTRPSIDEATIAAVGEVLRSGWITTGPKAERFEKDFAV